MKTFLFIALLPILTFSQNPTFERFAEKQDSLCTAAYEKRDHKQFEKLLSEFLGKYSKLKAEEKINYKGYLNGIYYNLACLYSLEKNNASAVSNLEKSVVNGYNNYYHILEDTDLDNIRNEEGYKKILFKLKETSDYQWILKRAENYNGNDNREVPKFTYQSPEDPHLTALRKGFDLDSVAGTGNEVSKILNLLHWMHNMVPHNGSDGNPEVKNAMAMINTCKKDKRGLNCRGMAMALTECYLALGFKARYLVCLPKDSLGVDQDCHVINMVYSKDHKKWLWIDPTFDAYVMNEQGELLSIEEVRDRVINNKPLILNPDANWNHKSSQSVGYYLRTYMAKNLYRFECAVDNQYDHETWLPGKKVTYVNLYPVEYFKQEKQKTEQTNTDTKVTFVRYPTNDPKKFWALPE